MILEVTLKVAAQFVRDWTLRQEAEAHEPDSLKVKLLCAEQSRFIAIDNSTGDCWVEEFYTKSAAIEYLSETRAV